MKVENIFEYAVCNKLRFPYKGLITVEDLFDLSVRELDNIFKVLNKQAKQSDEVSLLDIKDNKDTNLEVQIEIIKYIVKLKLEAQELKEKERIKKEEKQKIMNIIAEKRDAELKDAPIEELYKRLKELDE